MYADEVPSESILTLSTEWYGRSREPSSKDDELIRAAAYFERLRDELRDKGADKRVETILVAEEITRNLQFLRTLLAMEQRRR